MRRTNQPETFLCLSESIDLHRVDAAHINVPTSAVAVREDQLVPIEDMRALVARLPSARLQRDLIAPRARRLSERTWTWRQILPAPRRLLSEPFRPISG